MTTLDTGAATVAATTPYAWPFDGDLSPSGTAVLVVSPATVAWPSGVAASFADAGVEVVRALSAGGVRVISVVTKRRTASPHPISTAFTPDITISSPGIDGFYASQLEDFLRGARITRLVLVGHGLETSVHSTMRSANDRGFECLLVADACEPLDPSLAAASVSMIEMSGGIFGAVGTSAAVIAAFSQGSTS